MRSLIIHGVHSSEYKIYLKLMYSQIHQVFIQEKRWIASSQKKMMLHHYDTNDAIYFVTFNNDGSIQGCIRAMSSVSSSLLADHLTHLIEFGDEPRGQDIYEVSRFIVQPAFRSSEALREAKARVFVFLIEWLLEQGASHFQAVIDAGALASYVEITSRVRILGLAHPYGGGLNTRGGGECMALRWPVSTNVLDDVRAYGGLEKQVHKTRRDMPTAFIH